MVWVKCLRLLEILHLEDPCILARQRVWSNGWGSNGEHVRVVGSMDVRLRTQQTYFACGADIWDDQWLGRPFRADDIERIFRSGKEHVLIFVRFGLVVPWGGGINRRAIHI